MPAGELVTLPKPVMSTVREYVPDAVGEELLLTDPGPPPQAAASAIKKTTTEKRQAAKNDHDTSHVCACIGYSSFVEAP